MTPVRLYAPDIWLGVLCTYFVSSVSWRDAYRLNSSMSRIRVPQIRKVT